MRGKASNDGFDLLRRRVRSKQIVLWLLFHVAEVCQRDMEIASRFTAGNSELCSSFHVLQKRQHHAGMSVFRYTGLLSVANLFTARFRCLPVAQNRCSAFSAFRSRLRLRWLGICILIVVCSVVC